MNQTNEVPFDVPGAIRRVSAAADVLAQTLSVEAHSKVAGDLVQALRWGRYDEASSDWRTLRATLEDATGGKAEGTEGLAFQALAKAALSIPSEGGAAPADALARIEVAEVFAELLASRPANLPALAPEGRMAERLSVLSRALSTEAETSGRATSERPGLVWLSRWTARLARAAEGIQATNARANSVGILLDAIGLDEPVPAPALDLAGIAGTISEVRAAVVKWLFTSMRVEVIDPLPLVDRARGDRHEVEHYATAEFEEGLILRTNTLGWLREGRLERPARVVAARPLAAPTIEGGTEEGPVGNSQGIEPPATDGARSRNP